MIGIDQYRAAIGGWFNFLCCKTFKLQLKFSFILRMCSNITMNRAICAKILMSFAQINVDLHFISFYICILLLLCGDIHVNPGPDHDNKTRNAFSICQMNINSLYVRSNQDPSYKLDEIYSRFCVSDHYDVICLTETWLNPSIPDMVIELPGYSLHRRDRADGYGGVAIYIDVNVPSTMLHNLTSDVVENIWLLLNIGNQKMALSVFYRPPNSDQMHVTNFIEEFNVQLNAIQQYKPDLICITGDFNDRRSTWSAVHCNSDLKNLLFDSIALHNLSQVVKEPTYYNGTYSSILDLIITDSPARVMRSGVLSPVAACHHCPVYVKFDMKLRKDTCYSRQIWLYNRANFNDMNDYLLCVPWHDILNSHNNVNDNVINFTNILKDVLGYFIPNKQVLIRPKDKPWMTGNIRRLLRRRNRFHKLYRRTLLEQHRDSWIAARKQVKHEIKNQKKLYYDSIIHSLLDPATCSKSFWKTTKNLLGYKTSYKIPTLQEPSGKYFITDQEKAEHLAEYFAKQNTIDIIAQPDLPTFEYVTPCRLNNIIIFPENVYKILLSLNINKATGPDGIGNRVLKNCALSLSDPLCAIFNRSLYQGTFPTPWKDANLSSLFKSKEQYFRANYRPISLLSCISVLNVVYSLNCINIVLKTKF